MKAIAYYTTPDAYKSVNNDTYIDIKIHLKNCRHNSHSLSFLVADCSRIIKSDKLHRACSGNGQYARFTVIIQKEINYTIILVIWVKILYILLFMLCPLEDRLGLLLIIL